MSAEDAEALKADFQEKRLVTKQRMLGNIRFIGEAYKKDLVREDVMKEWMETLLNSEEEPSVDGRLAYVDEEKLEACCKLMYTIGSTFDAGRNTLFVNELFRLMGEIASDERVCPRMRLMLKGLEELRSHKWVLKRKEVKPQTLDDIRKEAEAEVRSIGPRPGVAGRSTFGQRVATEKETARGAGAKGGAAEGGAMSVTGTTRGGAIAARANGGGARDAKKSRESKRKRKRRLNQERRQQQEQLELERQLPAVAGLKGEMPQGEGTAASSAGRGANGSGSHGPQQQQQQQLPAAAEREMGGPAAALNLASGNNDDNPDTDSNDPQLSFKKAGDFLERTEPGIGKIFSLGPKLCVGIRGDGNCFWSAATVGALLSALCETDTRMLERVVGRFELAVYRGKGRISWGGLPSNIKAELKEFMQYVESLLDAKRSSTDPLHGRAQAAKLVRDFREPEDAHNQSEEYSRLYRGMVVASRMAAIIHAPKDAHASTLENFRTVNEYACEYPEDLRPGANLGVHMGLVQEVVADEGDRVLVTDYCEASTRKKYGMGPIPRDLLQIHDVAVRIGVVRHFDLRVKFNCIIGKVLSDEFRVPRASDAEARTNNLTLLKKERSSQAGSKPQDGACPSCTVVVEHKGYKCHCCRNDLPDGFAFKDGLLSRPMWLAAGSSWSASSPVCSSADRMLYKRLWFCLLHVRLSPAMVVRLVHRSIRVLSD
ncbi:unnamed protein product [Scytosiphon promiscuus]